MFFILKVTGMEDAVVTGNRKAYPLFAMVISTRFVIT